MAMDISGRVTRALCSTLCGALWPVLVPAATPTVTPAPAVVKTLLQHDLTGDAQREALMITVEYRPGGSSLPHRHDAQVFVYVLEGEITMQVEGEAPVTLRPGQTFYEGLSDIHRVSANASASAPAKMLVFMIKDKSKPVSRGAADSATP